jgi:hypothetical protein
MKLKKIHLEKGKRKKQTTIKRIRIKFDVKLNETK